MLFSNAVVVAPGGVGTLLELLYTWQLVQVKHIRHIPIILLGEMWPDFIKWLEREPLKRKYFEKHPEIVNQILEEGRIYCSGIARETLLEVREKMGLQV